MMKETIAKWQSPVEPREDVSKERAWKPQRNKLLRIGIPGPASVS